MGKALDLKGKILYELYKIVYINYLFFFYITWKNFIVTFIKAKQRKEMVKINLNQIDNKGKIHSQISVVVWIRTTPMDP